MLRYGFLAFFRNLSICTYITSFRQKFFFPGKANSIQIYKIAGDSFSMNILQPV